MALEITDLGNKAGELKFYGNIGTWFINSETFAAAFSEAEKKFTDLTIRLHSYGGQVFEGNIIYNIIAKSKLNIHVIIEGVAASMASVSFLPAKKISIVDNGFVMIHCPATYTSGNAAQHTEAANLLTQLENNFKTIYKAKTGKSEKEIAKFFDGNDHWLSASQALALGIVDEVVPPHAFITEVTDEPSSDATQEQIYNRYKAVATTAAPVATAPVQPPKQNLQNNNNKMKQLILATFGLTAFTTDSSDTAIVEALKAKFDDLTKLANDAKEGAIDAALATATLTDEQKKTYKEIGVKAGIEAMVAVLPTPTAPAATAAPGAIVAALGTVPTAATADDSKTWDWYQTNNPKALQAMADAKEDSNEYKQYCALFKAEFGTNPSK